MRKLDDSRLTHRSLGRGWRCPGGLPLGVALSCLTLLLALPFSATRAQEAADARPIPGTREWVVGAGDSWFSMRSRICPVESLKRANPSLAERSLREGERIEAPFVPAAQFDEQQQLLDEARKRAEAAEVVAEQEKRRSAGMVAREEAQQAELAEVQAALDAALSSDRNAIAIQLALGLVALLLAVGLAAAVTAVYSGQRARTLLERRIKQVEGQYTDLRRSISDLDVQLQRRMLKLLSWHESRVLTEAEVEEATAPVLELARRVKERHAG